MSPYGECNLSLLKNTRSANYFQIEQEKSYDYFLIMYITKLQCKMRFGVAHAYSRHQITSTSFTPPKQKIWLVQTKPSCLVADQKPEFCEYIALNWLFLHWVNFCFRWVYKTGGSVGWVSGCHAGGREFDPGRTNTQGLKITEEKVLPL